MNKELEQKLCIAYPNIFKTSNLPPTESLMGFGIECDDGWYDIIDDLCFAMSHTYTQWVCLDSSQKCIDVGPAPQVVAAQIKEKFGTLRFYYDLEYSEMFKAIQEKHPDNPNLKEWVMHYRMYYDGMVHLAETMSSRVCEVTGKRGRMHRRGTWYKTLCEEKAAELGYVPCGQK